MSAAASNDFIQAWRPNPTEGSYSIDEVDGEIPRELLGTLYRNGPNQNVVPKAGAGVLHLFDGDAMIHRIRIENGTARITSRYAETPSFLREREEGRYCLGGLNVGPDEGLESPIASVYPNTNVVPHAGRLLALVENAAPFELDPDSLDPKGFWDYDGKMLGMSTTAHPKIDGRTGQMWIHGYQPIEPYVQLYCVEPDGSVSLAETVDAPWPSMMHDFAITENYVIFPLGSVHMDLGVMATEGFNQAVTGKPELNMQFGIRRREAGSETRWFEAPSCGYMFHPGNAYERDGRIYMDACKYPNAQGLLDSLASARQGIASEGIAAHPFLYEFDLDSGTCKETQLSDISAEFPRIDDRRVGYENRWGYAATADPLAGAKGVDSVFRRITKYDREGGPSQNRPMVEGNSVGEPVFVPRSADAEEDDGFVLHLEYHGDKDRSSLAILDARGVDREPLARLWMPERIPMGFHGNFIAD